MLAHELGHHVHHDVPLGIAVQTVIMLGGFWLADLVMRWGIAGLGYTSLTAAIGSPVCIWAGDDAPIQRLVALAGGAGRPLRPGDDRPAPGLYQRHDPAG